MEAVEGEPLALHCAADGFPAVSINWKKSGELSVLWPGLLLVGFWIHISEEGRWEGGRVSCWASSEEMLLSRGAIKEPEFI